MSKPRGIAEERECLLKEVREMPPGPEALRKLAYVREEYDWAILDYQASLRIFSDTAYQDRKHFLLELIQNADDAQFRSDEAELTFVIDENSIELRYNEKGFDVEDMISITGTGMSTKVGRGGQSHSFIGEKGIGFKSVFALASEVEIESPPWHFVLSKEKPIIPKCLTSGTLKPGDGTRLRVTFSEDNAVRAVADELHRFVVGQVESFLFLQRLSCFTLEDHRYTPARIMSVRIEPPDRSGDTLLMSVQPNDSLRQYSLYAEDVEFPADLVAERWETLGTSIGPLKRKLVVAALVDTTEDRTTEGRLFCYLPTEVRLPVPIFLQVDGHTKADRERLHAPEQNRWNSYLIDLLPDFLLRAILSWRDDSLVAQRLPDLIPTEPGTDQLAPIFEDLVRLLKSNQWVRTFDENEEGWVAPSEAIRATRYWTEWLSRYPAFRQQAEKVLGKSFVHPHWTCNSQWVDTWDYYEIPEINELHVAKILESCEVPREILQNEDSLIELYRQLLVLQSLKADRRTARSQEIKEMLANAAIFPFENGEFSCLRSESDSSQVFYLSVRSRRKTGLEDTIDYRVIDPEYTYQANPSGDASDQRKAETKRINTRNRVVKDLLDVLEVPELNDETLLSDLQIPWLIHPCRAQDEDCQAKFKVLSAIFEAYRPRSRRVRQAPPDEEYLQQLRRLQDAIFPTEQGSQDKLCNLLLPVALRLKPEDELYVPDSLNVLGIPTELIEPQSSEARQDRRDLEDRRKKLKEDWRQFLIYCGIKNLPRFYVIEHVYDDVSSFRERDSIRQQRWIQRINHDYTHSNQVTVSIVQLDEPTRTTVESRQYNHELMAQALYLSWLESYGEKSGSLNCKYFGGDPPAGYFKTEYKRRQYLPAPLTKDCLWAGVDRSLIPIKTMCGDIVYAHEAIRISSEDSSKIPTAARYLPFVLEGLEEEGTYRTAYLDSLDVSHPTTLDVNRLWEKLDENDFPDIIATAVELIGVGLSPTGLELYDHEQGQTRPASQFCLGPGTADTPSIEEQYGNIGRVLGEKLGLSITGQVEPFLGLFRRFLSNDDFADEESLNKLYRLLKCWHALDVASRGELVLDLSQTLKDLELVSPPVIVYNDPDTVKILEESGVICIGLVVQDDEKYGLEKAAKELGLRVPGNSGELCFTDEQPLNETDRRRFHDLLEMYVAGLEHNEVSRLHSKLEMFGNRDAWSGKITRVRSAARVFQGHTHGSVKLHLPHLDARLQKLLVTLDDTPDVILAYLLDACEFMPFTSAKREIESIKLVEMHPISVGREAKAEVGHSQSSEEMKESAPEVAGAIKTALRDERVAQQYAARRGYWKVGLDPIEAERLRTKIGERLVESLCEGPEIHEKKIRRRRSKAACSPLGPGEKAIDPHTPDPKAFLMAEYDGKCQVCATELLLSNGQKWFNVFHIIEAQGENWWVDRPFNILCMCPNCHALAKHGGGRDLNGIYDVAQEILQGTALPAEIPEYGGDYYIAPVTINGREMQLVISGVHLNHFAALFETETTEDIAASREGSIH